ncbi:hypothetical protein EVG20_g11072, partial [Dentipellis fragilis]
MGRLQKLPCGCQERCKGSLMPIPRREYDRHAEFRNKVPISFSDFAAGRSRGAAVDSATRPSSSSNHVTQKRPHDGNAAASAGASAKQRRIELEEHSDGSDSVASARQTREDLPRPLTPDDASRDVPFPRSPTPLPAPDPSTMDTQPAAVPDASGGDTAAQNSRPAIPVPDPGSIDDYEQEEDEDAGDQSATEDRTAGGRPSLLHRDAREPMAEDSRSQIEDIAIAQDFISALRTASLDDDALPDDVLDRLRHPPVGPPAFDDPILRLSIKVYLALTNASQDSYNRVREAIHEELQTELLSFHQVKSQIAELSGVVPIIHHMCVNTCVAFTGPFADLDRCPMCQEPRYDQHKLRTSRGRVKSPRQVFHTMPLGPQLQARRRHPEMAEKMQHRDRRVQEILAAGRIDDFDDLYCGTDFLDAVERGDITSNDSVLLFSIDGAQLYQSKQSDCWMYMWVLLDLAPDTRYKKPHILPGGIIPGPHKPKNLDSFLFPGLHHLA